MFNKQNSVVHCFFEQSGTFKNELLKLGYKAIDYDILDDFGETDVKKDIFKALYNWNLHYPTFLDDISDDDLIIAFFPCVRFEPQSQLLAKCTGSQYKGIDDLTKLSINTQFQKDLYKLISSLNHLVLFALLRGVRLVIENPYQYNNNYYLFSHWPFKPSVWIPNRRVLGDVFEKPTGFWFFNFEPYTNLYFDEPIANYPKRRITNGCTQVERMMITKDFARNFLRTYVLPKEECHE